MQFRVRHDFGPQLTHSIADKDKVYSDLLSHIAKLEEINMRHTPYEIRKELDYITSAINQLRTDKKISQRKLAELADLHFTTIARVESYISHYSLQTLIQVCKALDVKVYEILQNLDI